MIVSVARGIWHSMLGIGVWAFAAAVHVVVIMGAIEVIEWSAGVL